MNGVFRALVGSWRLTFFSPRPERILNFALGKNLPFWALSYENGGISFSVRPWHKRHFAAFREGLASEERLEARPEGMLALMLRNRRRFGFFLGLLLLAVTLFLSTRVLWGVRVIGMQTLSEKEVLRELADLGLRIGTPLSHIDPKDLAMQYQVKRGDLVYVNVNLIGTKAYVELRERLFPEAIDQEEGFANKVAEIHGKIVRFEVLSGQIEVKKGENVTAGTLLISGVKENKNGTFTTVHAKGRVFAETQRSFETSIPFLQETYGPTGRERVETSLSVLTLTLPLPSKGEIVGEGVCILDRTEPITLWGYEIPVLFSERVFLETEEKKAVIKLDRAKELAYDKYEQFIRDTFAEGDEILSQNVEVFPEENGVTLRAEVSAIEDICKDQTFGVIP